MTSFSKRRRFFDGNPIAGVSAVVKNFLPAGWGILARDFPAERAGSFADSRTSRDVAQEKRRIISLVLAGIGQPLIVSFPFVFGGVTGQQGSPDSSKARRSGSGCGLALPSRMQVQRTNASRLMDHFATMILPVLLRAYAVADECRASTPCRTIISRRSGTPIFYWLRRFSGAPWLWRNPSLGCGR